MKTRSRKRNNKGRIVGEARELFRTRFPNVDEKAACLYLSYCIIVTAHKYGIELCLQAGSASWERVTPELDDGVCNTHFSYVWEPDNPQAQMRFMQGLLPEMHVWAANVATQELVDLTTGDIPGQCENLTGMDWPGNRPPGFIWTGEKGIPRGTFYEPDELATHIASQMLLNALRG